MYFNDKYISIYLSIIREKVSGKFPSHKKDPIQDLEFDKIENAPKKTLINEAIL